MAKNMELWITRFVRWCLFQRQPDGTYLPRPAWLFKRIE
jgi:hypothetical protein